MRATDCSSTRSSLGTCSRRRTKMPPGLSSICASTPEAIIPVIWSCRGWRYTETSSLRITSSTARPFMRQYECAWIAWRTSSIFSPSLMRSSTMGASPEMP